VKVHAEKPLLPADRATAEASYAIEEQHRAMEQFRVPIVHSLHGHLYTRTARMEAGSVVTSVLIKIPTTLVVVGDFSVLRVEGGERIWDRYSGTQVFAADAGRRMVYACHSDVIMTMAFPSQARTVSEAEAEFTDEAHLLQSRGGDGDVVINTNHGDSSWQE
jgi:hypothetical protein